MALIVFLNGQLQAAPLAGGKQKYLGGISSSAQLPNFASYWNQVTPENAGKWGSVEGTRDVMNWTELDTAYSLAKSNGFPFRMHILCWGSQQPTWIRDLSPVEQLNEIKQWFAAVAARYPGIDYLEVVNEALHDKPDITWPGNAGTTDCGNYKNALGGDGASGWEWVVQAFRLARQYFPHTPLVLNDYSIINDGNKTTEYIAIISLLKAENLVDVIAEQAHAFTTNGTNVTTLATNLNALAATGLPIWITEFDIDGSTDAAQLAEFQRLVPVLWEHPSVIGITTWGYRPGLWRTTANLIRADETERPAMIWLRDYITATTPNLRALIDSQPSNQAVNAGAGATFSVVARGNPAPAYQWQKNGVNIPGATTAALALTNVQPADNGATYRAVVANTYVSIISSDATLTVAGATPAITTQPASQDVINGDPVTLTVAASGSPAPAFQWKKNGVDIGGATGSSYTIVSVAPSDAGGYTVAAANSVGSAISNAAVISVIVAPADAIITITVE